MLKQRIITALVLLAILVPAVFYPDPRVFSAVAMVLIAAAAWEWAKLNQCTQASSIAIAVVCAGACFLALFSGMLLQPMRTLWLVTGSAWVILGAWLLYGGIQAWARVPQVVRLFGGVGALWVAWLAVAQARTIGVNFLFSVLVLVWAADIFAYVFGRAFGGRFFGRKLAPTISPGKTWEGVCGAMVGVIVCGLLWQVLDVRTSTHIVSIYTRLASVNMAFMALAMLFLTTMSIVGDLLESLFKRSAGVKDSSGLLPGHGGVLDRVDALLPILPLSMMLITL